MSEKPLTPSASPPDLIYVLQVDGERTLVLFDADEAVGKADRIRGARLTEYKLNSRYVGGHWR